MYDETMGGVFFIQSLLLRFLTKFEMTPKFSHPGTLQGVFALQLVVGRAGRGASNMRVSHREGVVSTALGIWRSFSAF